MNIMWFFVFTGVAFGIYHLFYKLSNDSMNPIGLMIFIYTLMAGVCHLNLGTFQQPWSEKTYILIWLSIIVMAFSGLIFVKHRRARECFSDNKIEYKLEFTIRPYFVLWIDIIIVCALIASIVTMKENGLSFTYVLKNQLRGNKGNWHLSSSTIIEYFVNMLPSLSIVSYFINTFSKRITKKQRIFNYGVIIYTVLYTSLVMVSRGTVIIELLGCLYIRHRKKHFSAVGLGRMFLVVVALFGVFTLFRWGEHDTSLAIYSGKSGSLIFNSVYNYIVYCFQNFDKLVRSGSPMTKYMYSLTPVAKLLGTYNEDAITYLSSGGFNAVIFITGPFHDLGTLGVIIYSAIDVLIVSVLYNMSNKNEAYSVCVGMLQKGIMVLFFGEYIFLLNGQNLCLFIMLILLYLGSNRTLFTLSRKKSIPAHMKLYS